MLGTSLVVLGSYSSGSLEKKKVESKAPSSIYPHVHVGIIGADVSADWLVNQHPVHSTNV